MKASKKKYRKAVDNFFTQLIQDIHDQGQGTAIAVAIPRETWSLLCKAEVARIVYERSASEHT